VSSAKDDKLSFFGSLSIEAARPPTLAGAIAALECRIVMFGGAPLSAAEYSLDIVIGALREIARSYGEAAARPCSSPRPRTYSTKPPSRRRSRRSLQVAHRHV
jgi:hypothetical protein